MLTGHCHSGHHPALGAIASAGTGSSYTPLPREATWFSQVGINDKFTPTTGRARVRGDDNTSLVEIYKTRLELLGYTCLAAYDGIDALALIKKERPDLVLLDLMVPKIAGDQILEIMRRSDWGKDIKVLIISNLNEEDATPGLREQGIEGYAVKANLSDDQLDQLVDNILKPAGQTEDINLDATPPPESTPVDLHE